MATVYLARQATTVTLVNGQTLALKISTQFREELVLIAQQECTRESAMRPAILALLVTSVIRRENLYSARSELIRQME